MKSDENIYIINKEDIQKVALDLLDRKLTDEEIIHITDSIEEKIHWHDIIEDSIRERMGNNVGKDDIIKSYEKRLFGLKDFNLERILKRINPFLFKSQNIQVVDKIVRGFVAAHLFLQEESIYKDWMIEFAILINNKVYGGKKSSLPGIDLEFDKNGIRNIVAIKSGSNWGNSTQISKMILNFNSAEKTLYTSNPHLKVTAINGCCYGRDSKPDKKGIYFKYCGQRFWEFISGDPEIYKELIEPLGHKAKEKNEQFLETYPKVLNKFVLEFIQDYCLGDGSINWPKIIELNSAINPPKVQRKPKFV